MWYRVDHDSVRRTPARGGAREAADRLNDQDLQKLLESVEQNRSKFEAALDDDLKNATLRGPRGEVKTNQFFDDLQDQVRERANVSRQTIPRAARSSPCWTTPAVSTPG